MTPATSGSLRPRHRRDEPRPNEIGYAVVRYLRGGTMPGWASLTAVISFLFGILFIVLGILGAYIARIHDILQNRPPFAIAQTTERVDAPS
jgi:hypothetical protein